MLKEHCTVSDLPTSLAIDTALIEARFNVVYKGRKKEQESLFVIQEMKKVVTENQEHNTGFLMSTSQSKCYVCSIFKRGNIMGKKVTLYLDLTIKSRKVMFMILSKV